MGHAGKCRALKSQKAVAKKFEYLENGRHPNHRNYKQPEKLRALGLKEAEDFPNRCQQLFDAWYRQNRLHTGRKPKVLAWWWMPRFADRVVLSPEEKSLVEKRLLTALPKGVLIVYNWHIPLPIELGRRPNGPDFNFLFSNLTRGVLPQLSRDSESSHWGILTKAMDNVVDEINENRRQDFKLGRTKDLTLIYTMAAAKARRKKRRPLPLCEQLACLPSAGDSLAELALALAELGYVYTPARNAGYVRRRHCPVLETGRRKHRFRGQGYFISLEHLLAEVQEAIQRRAKEKAMTAITPAAPQPSPASSVPAPASLVSPATVPPAKPAAPKLSRPAPLTAPKQAAPAPAAAAPASSPSPSRTPPAPKPPAHPATAPKVNPAPPASKAEATKVPASLDLRTIRTATEKAAVPARGPAVKPPPALNSKKSLPKLPATVVPEDQGVEAMSAKPPAGKPAPAQRAGPAPRTASAKDPAQSPPAPTKEPSAPTPIESASLTIKSTAPVKPPKQQRAALPPSKATPVTSSPATPTPVTAGQEAHSSGVNAPEAKATPELNSEQQREVAGALVRRILSAITASDPMPRSIEDCVILAQRAGVVLKISAEDSDSGTLRGKEQQCEVFTSVIQLAISMEIIGARRPKKARRPQRGQWEYIANTWVEAKYTWLHLIETFWDKTEEALKDATVQAAWIKASHEAGEDEIDTLAHHLHHALISADLEPDVALLIAASQAPATVTSLQALATRVNERSR
jgi:hypothetical protein